MIIDHEGILHLDSGHQDPRAIDNSPSCFTVYPQQPLKFTSDDFEVGLHEIQLPQTYWNITSDESVIAFSLSDCKVVGAVRTFFKGCYYSIYEITNMINQLFRNDKGGPRLEYDSILRRVVSVGGMFCDKEVQIFVTRNLSRIIGFEYRYMSYFESGGLPPTINQCSVDGFYFVYKTQHGNVYAENPLLLNHMIPRIQVHCSIVKQRCYSEHHLLRLIPLEPDPSYGAIVTKTFDRPIFLPLTGRLFDHIDIKITDCKGKLLKFQAHSVVVTLEFRRKSSNAFQ